MPIRLRRLDSRHSKFRSFRIDEDQPVDPARSWRAFAVNPFIKSCLGPDRPTRLLHTYVVGIVGGLQRNPFQIQNAGNFSGRRVFGTILDFVDRVSFNLLTS